MGPKASAEKKKPAVKKTTATKKKAAGGKAKTAVKKGGTAKKAVKKAAAAVKEVESKYELLGQKRDTPDESDPLRKFYESLRKQNPKSAMAEVWLLEHGLLESDQAIKDAYARVLKSKGKPVPKLVVRKVKKEDKSVKEEAEEPKAEAEAEVEAKPAAPKIVVKDDDDSD